MKLALTQIRTDGGTQPRADISMETVERYQEAIEGGADFPLMVVFHDGTDHWLADGFHRFRAFRAAGRSRVDVEVKQGTQRDAVLYSVGANALHGFPRSNADKRRAVETLLRDEEWTAKSDRWIAEQCAVSAPFVGGLRTESSGVNGLQVKRKGRDGKTYRKSPVPPAHQSAPLDASPDAAQPHAVRTLPPAVPEAQLLIVAALRPAVALAASWPAGQSIRPFIDSLRALADQLEGQEEERACRAN